MISSSLAMSSSSLTTPSWALPSEPTYPPEPYLSEEEFWMRSMNVSDDLYELISEDGPAGPAGGHNFCTQSVFDLGQSYKAVHGYIALLVCLFGTVANILNLIVLTRKEMATPINRMLTALAFADMLVMLEYVPFAFRMYVLDRSFTWPWALFVLFHSHFTQIVHTISIQLTLSMAVWRYVAIKCSNRSGTLCTMKRCHLFIAASFVCPIFICIPNYLTFSIYHELKYYFEGPPYSFIFAGKEYENRTTLVAMCDTLRNLPAYDNNCVGAITERDQYIVDLSELAKARNGLFHEIHFWTFSVIVKLIPCVVLTFFMVWLVNTLYKAKRRHKLLQSKSGLPLTLANQSEVRRKSSASPPARIVIDEASVRSGAGQAEGRNGALPVSCPSGESSRRESNQSGSLADDAGGGGDRRGTKGFIRLPSIRRPSHSTPLGSNSKGSGGSGKKGAGRRTDRTSKMLIAVLCLFLLTEFPQGIMAFLSGLYGQEFFRHCYSTWAEIWDIIALINSAINFILYCFMSKQFRLQFRQIFKPYSCLQKKKWLGITTCHHNHATVSTSVV